MKVNVGDKWAGLECTDHYRDEVVVKSKGVTERYKDWFVSLKCVCGNVVQIVLREFPGKRKMLDCGCGRGEEAAMERESTVISLYLPIGTTRRLKRYARESGVSVSRAAAELIDTGLGEVS